MTNTSGRTRRRGSGAGLVVGALAAAAVIGVSATQAGAVAPTHTLSFDVNLAAGASATGADAFTIGNYIFDPVTTEPICVLGICSAGTEGWSAFSALVTGPPLLSIGGASLAGVNLATQDFAVYDASSHVLDGDVTTGENFLQLANDFGYSFKIASTAASGLSGAGALPSVGTDYSLLQFNSPFPFIPNFTNVYVNTNTNLDPSGATDHVVFPGLASGAGNPVNAASTFSLPNGGGDLNLSGLLNFTGGLFTSGANAGDMNPALAFTALPAATAPGVPSGAFNINIPDSNGVTGINVDLLPTAGLTNDAFNQPVQPLFIFAPLISAAGASVNLGNIIKVSTATQNFNVYNPSTGASDGSVSMNEGMTTLFGAPNVQETVNTGSSGFLGLGGSPLPVGTTISVTNLDPLFHNGEEWVYLSVPGQGAVQSLVSQTGGTLATIPGFFDIDDAGTAGSATQETNPGNIFAGLNAVESEGATSLASGAFTINGVTLDPSEALQPASLTLGGAPLLAAYGGMAAGIPLVSQTFNVTPAGGTTINETFNEEIVKFLFFQNVSETLINCGGLLQAACPAGVPSGTVFDVLQLFPGFYNLYEATPGGGAPFDEVVTPLGPLFDFQLLLSDPSDSMNAAGNIDPGIVTDGLLAPY